MKDIVAYALKLHKLPADSETLRQLRKSKLPLFVWGCAKYAKFLFRILDKNRISVNGVFTDVKTPIKNFQGYEILSFDELCKMHKKFNIIVGHGEHGFVRKYKDSISVNNIFTIFDFPCHGFSLSAEYLKENSEAINRLYEKMGDELSRHSLKNYIVSRFTNDWQHIRPYVVIDRYFPEFMHFGYDEVVVDCGAYTGDTLIDFARSTHGKYKRYFAIEPDPDNCSALMRLIRDMNYANVDVVCKGVWDKKGTISFEKDNDTSHILTSTERTKGIHIMTESIDVICGTCASFIKMDIGGAELRAIKGAEITIRRNRPKLAISAYHRPEDLITIPPVILNYVNDYKLYFRLHNKLGTDAVLYAI